MKLTRLLAVAFLAFAPIAAVAQTYQIVPPGVTAPVAPPVVIAPIPNASPPAAPVTQNTVNTTGPVASSTTISVGTLAGAILNWIMVAFGPVIGGMVVWILVRVLNKLGIQATDAMRARLQEIVINGLNAGAKNATEQLQGRGQVEIKNAVVAQAVAYTQVHGAETIKALGIDPQSGSAVEAIKARIETAINDPSTPTPAVLDPTAAPKAV